MTAATVPRARTIALLYPGDRAMRARADPTESRFAPLFEAFAAAGIQAEPAVWHEDAAQEVATQLRGVGGVLVWCNPIEGGRRRDRLDALLRGVADAGVFVSAHPDAVLRLGTKDVLFDTRELPFGSDVWRIDSLAQLADQLPRRLLGGPRVLKQHRGHSGIGVWRVERLPGATPRYALHHAERGSTPEVADLDRLLQHMAPYFVPDAGGHMLDQPWQPGLAQGMVRAYLVQDRVAGFGHQAVNALLPAGPDGLAPQPGPRLYHGPELPAFQRLRRLLESQWIEQLCRCVGLPRAQLPLLWDCDFLSGEAAPGGPERHVLCEINVSSVAPYPPSVVAPLVAAAAAQLGRAS